MNVNKSTAPESSLGWREFADAVANGYHSIDNEGTLRCSGCSANIHNHEPHAQNCIVLRARAALDGEIQAAHPVDLKEIHAAVLAIRVDPSASKEKQHAFNAGIHSAAAAVSRFRVRSIPIETEDFEIVSEPKEPQNMIPGQSPTIVDEDGLQTVMRALGKQSLQSICSLYEFVDAWGEKRYQTGYRSALVSAKGGAGEIRSADVNSAQLSNDTLVNSLNMTEFLEFVRNYHADQESAPRNSAARAMIDHITDLCARNFKLASTKPPMTIKDLPPLPHAWRKVYERPHGAQELLYYTADQMRTYAMLAIKLAQAPINEVRAA